MPGSALRQLRRSFGGVLYVDGRWGTHVNGLHAAATAAGARVHTGATVAAIERDAGGVVRGVHLADGACLTADDENVFEQHIGPGRRRGSTARRRRTRDGVVQDVDGLGCRDCRAICRPAASCCNARVPSA